MCKAAAWSCEVDLPLSRCRMFQLRPPSVRSVVSGPGPDVNTAPVFVLARPPQETSPVWSLCIPKHAYPMVIMNVEPFKAEQIFHKFRKDFRGRLNVLDLIWGSGLRGVGGSDLYAFGLPVLLFQRSVDEDILLLLDICFGVMDGQFLHPTKCTPICLVNLLLKYGAHNEKVHQQLM